MSEKTPAIETSGRTPGLSRGTFVSEGLTPEGKDYALPPAIGEPALPLRFVWRKQVRAVRQVRRYWKELQPEGHRAGGELYLRRHWFELEMDDGATWTIYFQRQPSSRRATKARWWLYQMISLQPQKDGEAPSDDDTAGLGRCSD